jgi:hypothetical protein
MALGRGVLPGLFKPLPFFIPLSLKVLHDPEKFIMSNRAFKKKHKNRIESLSAICYGSNTVLREL